MDLQEDAVLRRVLRRAERKREVLQRVEARQGREGADEEVVRGAVDIEPLSACDALHVPGLDEGVAAVGVDEVAQVRIRSKAGRQALRQVLVAQRVVRQVARDERGKARARQRICRARGIHVTRERRERGR